MSDKNGGKKFQNCSGISTWFLQLAFENEKKEKKLNMKTSQQQTKNNPSLPGLNWNSVTGIYYQVFVSCGPLTATKRHIKHPSFETEPKNPSKIIRKSSEEQTCLLEK